MCVCVCMFVCMCDICVCVSVCVCVCGGGGGTLALCPRIDNKTIILKQVFLYIGRGFDFRGRGPHLSIR